MIQLRVRTEYNYRKTYGPVPVVAERLKELGVAAAAIVDAGTWGHVQWEKELTKAGIAPIFGGEFLMDVNGKKLAYWVLAEDLPAFYRFSSNPPTTEEELINRKQGLVVMAGAALTNPDAFDYIDINPRSRMRTRAALALAAKTGKPLLATSDNDYPGLSDRSRFAAWVDSTKMTPQHILTDEEWLAAMSWVSDAQTAVDNANALGARLVGRKLRKAPIISVDGDLVALIEQGLNYRMSHGHIPEWTSEYQARLDREIELIKQKKFESYFIVVADLITWAKERMLVGPGRGSSAGSLVCYLLRITEVDPLVHNLIFERFIDVNRADLPDIDIDFNDQKRELVFEYMRGKYGNDKTARIGSVNRLKPRSVIAHVGKRMGVPHGATFGVTNVLIEYSSGDSRYGKGLEDTLSNTQPGRDFLAKWPEAGVMTELENHASHSGVHAAGFIVANEPVTEYCTVVDGIAQIDKVDAEYLNLLKIDALGLRTLGVIEETGCVTAQELYDQRLDDPEVFRIFNEAKFSGVFQFEGGSQRRVSIQIPIKEFQQIDHITALARPGPLGGGAANTYIDRINGREATTYKHESMRKYLEDTQGVVLYQEQVMRIVKELGDFSWEDTSIIRKAMSGRKGKEFFDRHGEKFALGAAAHGVDEATAKAIWNEIVNFGAWGMNKSHTVAYSVISYWCAYMKRYHALEYAAACLRNAKDDEQTIEVLRELDQEGVPYTPFDAELSDVDWSVQDGKLVGGFKNLHGIGPAKAMHYKQLRDTSGLTPKDYEALAKHQPKHTCLRPAHALWGDYYAHPENYNIHGPVKEFTELEDFEDAVVVCQLVRQERRDENEAVRQARRGHALNGQTLFLDAFVVDDSVSKPVIVRIKRHHWHAFGVKMADRAVPKQDWFLVRGRWLKQFSMLTMDKIKCLTNSEMFL